MSDYAKSAAQTADKVATPAAQLGMGQVKSWGHPLHPATVHFPIGFLSLSLGLDALQIAPALTKGLTYLKVLPPAAVVNTISHYTGAAGLLFALPAIATGVSELYGMWKGQAEQKGLKGSVADAAVKKDVAGEKLKTTLTHATLNDLVVGVAAYNWWVRRQSSQLILPRTNAILAAVALPVFFYSAYLGGSLVYEYSVGVQRQGEAAEIAEKQSKEAHGPPTDRNDPAHPRLPTTPPTFPHLNEERLRTLSSLTLASRRLRSLAQPLLDEVVDIRSFTRRVCDPDEGEAFIERIKKDGRVLVAPEGQHFNSLGPTLEVLLSVEEVQLRGMELEEWGQSLESFSKLQHLTLNRCKVPFFDEPPPFSRLVSLVLDHITLSPIPERLFTSETFPALRTLVIGEESYLDEPSLVESLAASDLPAQLDLVQVAPLSNLADLRQTVQDIDTTVLCSVRVEETSLRILLIQVKHGRLPRFLHLRPVSFNPSSWSPEARDRTLRVCANMLGELARGFGNTDLHVLVLPQRHDGPYASSAIARARERLMDACEEHRVGVIEVENYEGDWEVGIVHEF
ncbi:hypothetical protein JCM8097_005673 [Rhodosporidiobolus ruineniae]